MKIKSGFIIEQVGGAYLAVATGERAAEYNSLIRLNGTGAFLWNLLCERDMTEEELLSAMLSEYDVEEDIARKDILAFKDKLMSSGLLDD